MIPIEKNQNQGSLFFSFRDTLNPKHPLIILADKIQWDIFEKSFRGLYSADNGRPAKPIRLMVGLLMLKHIRNLSDEAVVEEWSENLHLRASIKKICNYFYKFYHRRKTVKRKYILLQ